MNLTHGNSLHPVLNLLLLLCVFISIGCSTVKKCQVNVSPEEYKGKVHHWMAEASKRYEGRAWRDFVSYDIEIVTGKYLIRDGKGGHLLVNGNSVGTHASGKYRSKVNNKGNTDKYGIWEALNVLSAIHDGQMLDGKQPRKGGRIQWP